MQVSDSYSGPPDPSSLQGEEVVHHGRFSFGVLRASHGLDVWLVQQFDAVILDALDESFCEQAITSIRAHVDPGIYLTPIFLLGTANLSTRAQALIDGGVTSLEFLNGAAEQAALILRHQQTYVANASASFDDSVLTKVLRFMVSRGRDELSPLPDRSAKLGLTYPILSVNYPFENEHKGQSLLDLAVEEHLLTSAFFEAWYLCSTCMESHLHLREVCPTCGTAQLEEEELVHHFRCAFVGPLSDFTGPDAPDTLVCPKCEHVLRHIGVDYDKPSTIFTCANGHTAQAAPVKARCYTCGTETPAEQLTKKVFRQYRLTPRGREKARSGVEINVRYLSQIDGTIEMDVLTTMLSYEVRRVEATGRSTTLAVLRLDNVASLFSFFSREERVGLLTELVALVRAEGTAADVISLTSYSTLVAFLPATDPDAARSALRRAAERIAGLLKERYEGFDVDVSLAALSLRGDLSADEQVQTMLTDRMQHA